LARFVPCFALQARECKSYHKYKQGPHNAKQEHIFASGIIQPNYNFGELETRENTSANKIKALGVFGGSSKRISAIICTLSRIFILSHV
jgi:hypothetical protein